MSNDPKADEQVNPTDSSALGETDSKPRIPVIAEYASLGLSAAGTAASILTKQAAYATAPLSVSLFLNLLNRQQLRKHLEQQTQQTTAQIQHLNQSNAQLEPALESITQQFAELQQQVADQAERLNERSDLKEEMRSELGAELKSDLKSELGGEIKAEVQQAQLAIAEQCENLEIALQDSLQEALQRVNEVAQLAEAAADQAFSAELQQLHKRLTDYIDQHQGEVTELRQAFDGIAVALPVVDPVTSPVELPPVEPPVEPEPAFVIPPVPVKPPVEPSVDLDLLFLNLGIDFGTRYTKICFQNLSDDRSEIIPFCPKPSALQDVLLATKIGILPDGRLFAGLTESEWQALPTRESDLVVLDSLKMRLADLDLGTQQQPWRLEAFPELDEPENVENLCAYFLSQVIRRSQNWVRNNRTQLVARQKIEWSANVGVPVAYCDSKAGDRFQQVLSLAWQLSNEPKTEEMTLPVLRKHMDRLRSQPISDNCRAIPEVAAGAWSFLNTRQASDNFYLFFDIGDGSLDGCALHFYRKDDAKIDFYHGQVDPLGVRAFSQRLSQELLLPEPEARALLEHSDNPPNFHASEARKLLQRQMVQVISQGGREYKKHHPVQKEQEFEAGLSVFLLGGGSQLDFFRRILPETHQDFGQAAAGIGPYQPRELPRPENLEFNGIKPQEFYRFSVAYGLATPYEDLDARVRLPKEVKAEEVIISDAHDDSHPIKYEDSKDYS